MPRIVLIEVLNKLDEVSPSVSLGYLASYLLKYLGEVEIKIERSTGKIPIKLLPDDLVGISVVTQNYNFALELAKNIKSKFKSIPVIIGGHHISPLPESMSEDMNIAVLYEGHETFLELVKLYFSSGFNKQKLLSVMGIAFIDKGKLIRTPARPYVKNLDDIPPPARHLTIKSKPVKTLEIITSMGCPYQCVFCGCSAYWGKIRYHSPEYVNDEIDQVMSEYQPTRLNFLDDLIIADKDRFYKIISHFREKNYHKTTDLYFTGHVNFIDKDLCEMIKGIKCSIWFGFESGSDNILKKFKTGNVTVEKNQKILDLLTKYPDVLVGGFFMCGLPGETVEDLEKTYKFISSNKRLDHFGMSVVTPFPGTYLWKYAFDKGLVSAHMDWNKLRFNSKTSLAGKVLINDVITRKEFERMMHKINNYGYGLIAKAYSFGDIVRLFRVDALYVLKNIIGNPTKFFNILYQLMATKIKLLLGSKR